MQKDRKNLIRWFDFISAFTKREIKAKYTQTIFGFLWIGLGPIFQMIIIGFVFQFFVPVKVDNYFLFLFSGLLPWSFFSTSVLKSTSVFLNERSLIGKANFPKEAIVLSVVVSNIIHFLVSLLIFLTVFSIVDFPKITWIYLALPILWFLLLSIGTSFLFSSWGVRFRDMNFIVSIFMPLWFYATPIMYTMDLIPISWHWLFELNPAAAPTRLFQTLILGEKVFFGPWLIKGFIFLLLILFLGLFAFKKESPYFDDYL